MPADTPSKYIIGTDVGIFPFPTIDPAQKNVEGSADTLMVLVDRPEVRAVAEFLATPEGIQNWIRAGSAISTNTRPRPTGMPAPTSSRSLPTSRTTPPASASTPPTSCLRQVGAGTFWTKMDDWANNSGTNTDAVLKAIDDSWPAQ